MKKIKLFKTKNLIKSDSKLAKNLKGGLKKSKKSGFTLIEFMVVVATMAVLVTFSTLSMASVNRRNATRAGKLIDSELSTLASNAYSREGAWRIEFEYNKEEGRYYLTQQYNPVDATDDDQWVDFSSIKFSTDIDISFGGDGFDESRSGGTHYISVSKENGNYLTEGYFCDNIYVHSKSKVVTIHLSPESGGHRVID